MKISRRSAVLLLAGAALFAPVLAQPTTRYPAKPIRMIVPFAPGGGSDAMARLIAQKLTESHGYTIVIDNKPGAGGNLGAEAALREPADGYTLLVISGSYAGNAVVNKPAFDPAAAIEPIIQFTREPVLLVAGPASPFKSLIELVAEAKTPARLPSMPNVPTFAEQGLGAFRADLWHGLVAAKGVPADVIAKLNADINGILRSPDMTARLAADDVAAAGGTPQQFSEVIRADMERWRGIVMQADIKLN